MTENTLEDEASVVANFLAVTKNRMGMKTE